MRRAGRGFSIVIRALSLIRRRTYPMCTPVLIGPTTTSNTSRDSANVQPTDFSRVVLYVRAAIYIKVDGYLIPLGK
jgi:hypothetical protein